jgi:hypothetical protein
MNLLEKKMFDILIDLRYNFYVKGIKAEFEAEGTRIDELLRLVDLVKKANLKLGIKIGGCEALKDLMEVKQIGTDYVIAPMIETEYALKKFIESKNKIFDQYEKRNTIFLVNIETIQGLMSLQKIIKENTFYKNDGIQGIVFGRVDFTLSKGLSRDQINDLEITNSVIEVAKACKKNNLEFVMGGGISIDSLSVLKEVSKFFLTRYETRKVIFSKNSLKIKNIKKGMLQSVQFELLCLQNKKSYYGNIFKEDDKRIKMLTERWIK